MKNMTQTQMMRLLVEDYPTLDCRISEMVDGTNGAIYIYETFPESRLPVINFFPEFWEEHKYELGILIEFKDYVEEFGWFCEPLDAETLLLTINN